MYIFRVSFDRSDAIRKGDTDAEILNIIHDTVMKKKKQHAGKSIKRNLRNSIISQM